MAYDKKASNKRWYEKNKEKQAANGKRWREINREKLLGYQKHYREQTKDKYANYWRQRDFAVDHSHTTGKIRELLCQPCNVSIGLFQDNPEFLVRASEYLKETL